MVTATRTGLGLALLALTIACAPVPVATGIAATPPPTRAATTPTPALATVTPVVTRAAVTPTPTSVPPTPGATRAAATPVATNSAWDAGYLEGRASIGPLTPVERVGVPPPTPSPAVCTARGLAIYQADGTTEVTSFALQPDCTYRVALRPGAYLVRLKPGSGIEFSKDLPKTVTITGGQTIHLDVNIDTGIR